MYSLCSSFNRYVDIFSVQGEKDIAIPFMVLAVFSLLRESLLYIVFRCSQFIFSFTRISHHFSLLHSYSVMLPRLIRVHQKKA